MSNLWSNDGIWSNGTWSKGTTISVNKTTYNILGEYVTIEGYQDINMAIIISSINIMGKPFYDDILKQGVHLPEEIKKILDRKFIILERDRKIEEVIKKD